MGSRNRLKSTLSQTIVVPPQAQSLVLNFWAAVVTQEKADAAHDQLRVELRTRSGGRLGTLITVDNRDARPTEKQSGEYAQFAHVFLSPPAGEKLQLVFTAESDANRPTLFRLDDVSLQASLSDSSRAKEVSK
jgi:hypothetical protein